VDRVRRFSTESFRLSCRIHTSSCDAARSARKMRTIGFCHLLLQSRAPVSRSFSTRSRPAPPNLLLAKRSPSAPSAPWSCLPVCRADDRAPRGFTPPWWLRWTNDFDSRRITVEPMSCLSRLLARASLRIPPQRPTRSSLRRDRLSTKPVKTSSRYDPTRLSSRRSISSTLVLRRSSRVTGTGSRLAACAAFVGFAANAPCTALFRFSRCSCLLSTSAKPRLPFTPANRIDAGASLSRRSFSTSATEFSKYDTRARFLRAVSSRAAGDCPANVATTDALFTLLAPSSFDAKKTFARSPQRATRFLRRLGSRPKPREPVSSRLQRRRRSSGSLEHEKRAGRKS